MVWLFNENNDFDLRNLIKKFLSTDSCTDIYRGVNIISNCVSAAWHFSLLCLITTWCSCRGNHNFTGRKGAWGLWHKGHTMFVETVFHRIVCCVWSACVVYVTGFMYTFMCICPFLCVESLLPFPPHLYILSSWQVLLGVIDKRKSFANEGVIFKLSMG